MNSFNALSTLPPLDDYSSFQLEAFHLLKAINSGKASGPNGISNSKIIA